jgi:hypothetical protein
MSTKEHPRNSFGAFQSQLEQPFTEGLGVWFTKIRPERNHATG